MGGLQAESHGHRLIPMSSGQGSPRKQGAPGRTVRYEQRQHGSDSVTEAWTYEHNTDNSARFVLGTVGDNPLVCVGVNPSTAAPGDPDHTVSKVMGFASRYGFDSWVMLNLYPQRSTDPKGMHLAYSPELQAENEKHIADVIDGRPLTVLAAWGELIETRTYLPQMLEGIVSLADASDCNWVSIGGFLKSGHPRHPSRASYDWPLQSFDVGKYLSVVAAPIARQDAAYDKVARLVGVAPHEGTARVEETS